MNRIPNEWRERETILLHKRDSPAIVSNWWPISMQQRIYMYKVYAVRSTARKSIKNSGCKLIFEGVEVQLATEKETVNAKDRKAV